MKKRKLLGGFNRFRLILTLGIAVLLPAAALIVVNFYQLQTFKRDKVLEAAIHRDFSEYLAISEKTIVKKFMSMAEDARNSFPPPNLNVQEKEKALDEVLKKNPNLVHAFMYDEKGMISRTQPSQVSDEYVRKERDHLADSLKGWFGMEGAADGRELHKKSRPFGFYNEPTKRPEGQMHLLTAYFTIPNVPKDRVVWPARAVDPHYLKNTFFPGMLKEVVDAKSSDQSGNQIAMMIYPTDYEGKGEMKPLAMTAGWGEGSRKPRGGSSKCSAACRWELSSRAPA